MIGTRHLGAAPDDTEADFDAALVRTHALTLASDLARGASGLRMLNPSSCGADGNSSLRLLWEDSECVFCRGNSHGDGTTPVLAVLPAAEHPAPAVPDRHAPEYELRDEPDRARAARPLELMLEREDGNSAASIPCFNDQHWGPVRRWR